MKILVIEDESIAAEKIRSYLSELFPSATVFGPIISIEDGIKWLNENEAPDVIISDIMLTDGLSFDIFKATNTRIPIIFTTAYDKYALNAFEVNSVDYLLKPVTKERLKQSLDKIPSEQTKKEANIDFDQLAKLLQANNQTYKSRFLVKVGQKIRAIPTTKIAYFFTQDKLSYIVSHQKEKYPVDHSLEEIDSMINPNDFFRINRKYIIHIEAVKEIHPYFKGRLKLELIPETNESIVISAEKTPSFKAWLDK